MEDILDDFSLSSSYDGPSLQELYTYGYKFDFGKYFTVGWNAMKNDVGQYILFFFVAMLIFFVSFVTIIGPLFIALPLFAGVFTYGRKALLNEPREFNDFFGGFKSFGPLVGYTFLMIAASLFVGLPLLVLAGFDLGFFEALGSDPKGMSDMVFGAMIPAQLGFMVVGVVLQTLLFFTIPLIVIGKLGTLSAIGWSMKIVSKNFWWVLLYIIVAGFVQQAGIIACYVGLLFTVPLAQCLYLGAYAGIVGLAEKNPSLH